MRIYFGLQTAIIMNWSTRKLGAILDCASDGKLHEHFQEWKKVSFSCRGLKMTKADLKTMRLCFTSDHVRVGRTFLTRQQGQMRIARNGKSISKRRNNTANPEGANSSRLLSTRCSYKVTCRYQSTSRSASKSLYHRVGGQRTPKTWLSECHSPRTKKSDSA